MATSSDPLAQALDAFYAQQAEPINLIASEGNRPWTRPIKSVALAVHPDQIEEARATDKARGVPVDYTPDGRPVFTSGAQFRAYCKAMGFRHRGY